MHPFFQRFHDACHPNRRHPGHHAGRHGHRGFGAFAGRHGFPGTPDGASFDGLSRGRKLGSADLQLLLLALLAERPSHGYELIKALDERSNGYYSPSPGMVYPALTYLEEIGHASVEVQGTKKLYSITDAGRAHLDGQRANATALLDQLAWIGQRFADARRAMAGGSDAGDAASAPEVRAARRSLKSALIAKAGASADEQRRIAAILEQAAAAIRGDTRDA